MLYRTISKKFPLVIFCLAVSTLSAACGGLHVKGGKAPAFDGDASRYEKPRVVGRIQSADITESSGIAASKCQPGVLWTHNDSGDAAFVFAIDETGKDLGTWKVENAENVDWEDITEYRDANGKCFLYIGDIGDDKKNPRGEHKIYRVPEPTVPSGGGGTSRKNPAATAPAEVLTFSYPDEKQDAETLMVHPTAGSVYVVTKQRDRAAGVYRITPAFGSATATAEKVAEITVPAIPNGFLTGGDISPDGRSVVICDYFAAYEFSLPAGDEDFDDVWKQRPTVIELGERKQGEAVAYAADGKSIFATSEGRNQPLIQAMRK